LHTVQKTAAFEARASAKRAPAAPAARASTKTAARRPKAVPRPSPAEAADALDDAWAVLSEALVIREQLSTACAEVKTAIDAIRARLERLGIMILEKEADDPQPADQLLEQGS
jgi:hypothetical protein